MRKFQRMRPSLFEHPRSIEEVREILDFYSDYEAFLKERENKALDKALDKAKDKDKKDKEGKPPTFTFLEMLGIVSVLYVVIGAIQHYAGHLIHLP